MFDWTTTGALILGVVVVCIVRRTIGTQTPYPLPPGPPGLPWIGNVIGANASTPWITYAEWARTYGGSYISFLVIFSTRYRCRRHNLFSAVGKGYHRPQFRKDCRGSSREPVQDLFRPSILHHRRDVGFFLSYGSSNLNPLCTIGVGWISIPLFCLTASVGACTGAFSTKHFDPMQCIGFYPPNTARHVISSGGCWIPLNNSIIMFSSKYIGNVTIDPTQFPIKIHGRSHHEQHVRL